MLDDWFVNKILVKKIDVIMEDKEKLWEKNKILITKLDVFTLVYFKFENLEACFHSDLLSIVNNGLHCVNRFYVFVSFKYDERK